MKRNPVITILLTLTVILSGCGASQKAQRPAPLVIKNIVTADAKSISTGDLSSLITVIPNKKLLGTFRARLWVYEHLNRKERTNKRGEAPALLDSALMYNTARQMKLYLNNSGYFESTVIPKVKVKKEKATIDFQIKAGVPYRYSTIEYEIHDSLVKKYIDNDKGRSHLKINSIYNAYTLDDERDRITRMLKNNGFYLFGKNYIRYEADSSQTNKQISIKLIIDPFRYSTSSYDSTEYPHNQYYINNIFINPDYQPLAGNTVVYDTTVVYPRGSDSTQTAGFLFLQSQKPRIHPYTITNSMFLFSGKKYSMEDVKQTQNKLGNLRIYKFANVEFENPTSPFDTLLDCRINLIRRPVHSPSIQTEVTNSAGNPGVGGNFFYENKNLFRRGEVFRLTLRGALEAQAISYDEDNEEYNLFNTLEMGSDISLVFPKFLFPFRQNIIPAYFSPKTVLSAGYNFQRRPDYSRHITNFSFGYEWKQGIGVSHSLNPLEINSVKIYPDSAFQAQLDELQNALYKSQYTDHMIVGLNYSYIRTTQTRNKTKDFTFFKGIFETSGNLLRAYNKMVGSTLTDEGYFQLFNIRYTQYVKGEVDFRYYNRLPYENQLVYRLRAGVGIPYGNSVAMPFEKGFYGGGSNDMRGWKIRTLGPGSFNNDSLYVERIGDILLELNFEYRFPIYKWFRGALFVDTGNIWLLNENEDFAGGKFEFNDFIKELSVSSGLGLRLDFDFFIIRLDGGIPIHDPAAELNNRWTFNRLSTSDIVWNIAIGYPF